MLFRQNKVFLDHVRFFLWKTVPKGCHKKIPIQGYCPYHRQRGSTFSLQKSLLRISSISRGVQCFFQEKGGDFTYTFSLNSVNGSWSKNCQPQLQLWSRYALISISPHHAQPPTQLQKQRIQLLRTTSSSIST